MSAAPVAAALSVRPLITAQEAFPELERQFLAARSEIWASFRIFDLDTRLRSEEGRAVGATWFDLIVHCLRRGVALNFVLADFDPHFATPLHMGTWRSVQQFAAASEIAGPNRLRMRPMMHASRAGLGPRAAFWALVVRRMPRVLRKMDGGDPRRRAEILETAVGLRARLAVDGRDRLRVAIRPMPDLVPAIHHQKLAVFDRERLYIGGLDLDERRYDDPQHRRPAARTWHDVSVLTQGACAQDAQAHLEAMWGAAPPAPPRPAPLGNPAFVRTLSRDASERFLALAPRAEVREIEAAHLALFARAERLIYLETQFFRYRPFARALARAAQARPGLHLIMILPAAPEDVAFERSHSLEARFGEYLQARCVRRILQAFGQRAFVGVPLRPVAHRTAGRDTLLGSDIIYVHSKIAIADDAQAIVSSANLNGRSMRWDSEAGVVISDAPTVGFLRQRLFAHWLPEDAGAEHYDPATAGPAWAALARANAALPPGRRRGFLAPYDVRAAEAFGQNVPLLPEEMV